VLGNGWIPHLRSAFPRLCIVIKPHPVTPDRTPDWMECWKKSAANDHFVRLSKDPSESVYSYSPLADALLTDASSVLFYFLAMDKLYCLSRILIERKASSILTLTRPNGHGAISAWR
jgi:hypothetical protein